MGAAATGTSSVADASLNVVPSIDLLVCLICFLLVSSSWLTLSRLDVEQVIPRARPSDGTPPPAPPTIEVAMTKAGYAVRMVEAAEELAVPTTLANRGEMTLCRTGASDCGAAAERYQRMDTEGLQLAMQRLLERSGAKAETRVLIAASDDVPYLHVIATMDAAIRTCVGAVCLSHPTVGDIAVLRAKGMVVP
jgi:biopolymer transport protein ExbD